MDLTAEGPTPRERIIESDRRLLAYADSLKKKGREGEGKLLLHWASFFRPFQRCWLFDPSRFAICCKSRQIGISHTTGGFGVVRGVFFGELTTIISKNKDASNNVLMLAKKLATVLRRGGSELAKMTSKSKEHISFASGGSIISLPSTGGRSYSGNVVLDEFAYQEHAKDVWDNAAPVASLGHMIRVVSTPNGVGNEFHDLWEYATNPERAKAMPRGLEDVEKWTPHYIPLGRAIADGFKVSLKDCWAIAKGDPRIFGQMYQCSFLDTEFQYIPTATINGCLSHELEDASDGVYYAGLDIGRDVDLSVLVVIKRYLEKGQTRFRIVHVETMKRTDQEALEEACEYAFERFKLKRLCIDRTGLGTFPADRIKKKHSEKYDVPHRRPRVDLIDFSERSKEELATGLYASMTSRALYLPASDAALPSMRRIRSDGSFVMANEPGTFKHLKREIASLQRRITKAANVVYETPRTREGHADRAWALMLAIHATDAVHPMILALSQQMAS